MKTHWRDTLAKMKHHTTKANETWIDYSKNCNTKTTNMMQQLLVELQVASGFVESMDGTDQRNAHATRAVTRLDEAAKEAAACWKSRKGGRYTQEELDVDYTEFEKHRKRLLFDVDNS